MKICIPVEMKQGDRPVVYGHFGSAPFFIIFDLEKNESKVIKNGNMHHVHGACNPVQLLAGEGVSAVVCGGMGVRAVNILNSEGIRVFRSGSGTIKAVAEAFRNNSLEEITAENACANHSCGGKR